MSKQSKVSRFKGLGEMNHHEHVSQEDFIQRSAAAVDEEAIDA